MWLPLMYQPYNPFQIWQATCLSITSGMQACDLYHCMRYAMDIPSAKRECHPKTLLIQTFCYHKACSKVITITTCMYLDMKLTS